ncbi:MAG: cyclic nucleotide-binding domain-containing protein [Bacteroidia bacterium]|nr:cyclic nucleotide-binding domain-containing protein [Bacteroidia bacterium]
MEIFKNEIEKYSPINSIKEWEDFSASLSLKEAAKRDTIFRQTDICDKVIYLLDGIAASEYNADDRNIITRFFQYGNLCSNMESAATQSIQSDNVFAITKVRYVEIPFDSFMQLYLKSNEIGLFFRKKILEHLVEAKNFLSIKTSTSTEIQYSFLENNYPSLIQHTPSKYIAAFIGITPEALSRFLKLRSTS